LAEKAIFIEGVGGLLFLEEEGDFLLADNTKFTVFVVGQSNLPPNAQILLGIEHIKDLRISIDFAIDRPFCQLEEAMAYGQASLARFSSLVSVSKEKEGPLSSLLALDFLDDSLAVAPICLFMVGLCLFLIVGLCLSLMGPHFAALAVFFAGVELHPARSFMEVSLLLGLSFVLWRGLQFPRCHRAFTRDPTRANFPRASSRLSPEVKGCLARMHARDFASVFSPPPAFSLPKSGVLFSRGGEEARHHGKETSSTRAGVSPVPSDRIVLEG
jgi:hypothetical protein